MQLGDGWELDRVALCDLGQVVGEEPHLRLDHRIHADQHDAATRDALHLGDAALGIRPMVDRQDRHRRVDGLVGKW
jgi:hypothetical protein